MLEHAYAVIMAGGKGERFWPLSTAKRPKQVLSLVGGKPMIALAVERLKGLIPPERVIVVTSESLVGVTRNAAPDLPENNIIGEPFGRDTAAACALGCAVIKARDPEGVFCVLTADHIIKDLDSFRQTLRESLEMASEQDILITIGIHPTHPSTGYGYIEADAALSHEGDIEFMKARRFVEKPDHETAETYIDAGNFCWNSGMFIWSAASFHKALESFATPLAAMSDAMQSVVDQAGFTDRLREEYDKLERISVDYAIMEKADNIIMAKGVFRWYDVGSWPALEDHFETDESKNIRVGQCETVESENNVIVSNDRLTALIGVKDLVVVQAENATLVCSKEKAQDVKKMVQLLSDKGGYDHLL